MYDPLQDSISERNQAHTSTPNANEYEEGLRPNQVDPGQAVMLEPFSFKKSYTNNSDEEIIGAYSRGNNDLGGGSYRNRARGSAFLKRLSEKDCSDESYSIDSMDNSSVNLNKQKGSHQGGKNNGVHNSAISADRQSSHPNNAQLRSDYINNKDTMQSNKIKVAAAS